MESIITKICIRCGKEKSEDSFYFNLDERGRRYVHRKCTDCCRELARQRYNNNMSDEERRISHNSKNRKLYSKSYRKEHPLKFLVASAKLRAKERNIEFDLHERDLFVPEICPYLGIPIYLTIDNGKGKGRVEINSASLDRIDSSKGYIPGNVQIISHLANRMKSNATPEQLVAFAKNVLRMYSK